MLGQVTAARCISVPLFAALLVSCGIQKFTVTDSSIEGRIPPGATMLAGVHLDRLRESSLFQQLPPSAAALLAPWQDAVTVLAASNGPDYVVLARGTFAQPPAGSTLLEPGLAGMGTAEYLKQTKSPSRRNPLFDSVGPLAATSEIWAIAAGGANLPLSGNAENFNRLLHRTRYAALSVKLTDHVMLDIAGICANPDAARELEETVRAMITLGGAFSRKDPVTGGLLKRIQLDREGNAVRISLTVSPAELEAVLKLFS